MLTCPEDMLLTVSECNSAVEYSECDPGTGGRTSPREQYWGTISGERSVSWPGLTTGGDTNNFICVNTEKIRLVHSMKNKSGDRTN